jgi:ATP-dependent protease ClpP protease subunit
LIAAFVTGGTVLKNSLTEDVPAVVELAALQQDENSLITSLVEIPKLQTKNAEIKSKRIGRLNLNVKRTILLQGPIFLEAAQVSLAIKQMNALSEELPIYLVITSPGGSVAVGSDIINAIAESKAPVYTVCRILCASMASMIHQHGDKRFVTDRTQIMFHPASTEVGGKVNEIVSYINSTKSFISKIEIEVAEKLGLTHAQYEAKVQNEWWIDSDEALEAKAVDAIVSIDLALNLYNPEEDTELKGKEQDLGLSRRKLIWIYEGTF